MNEEDLVRRLTRWFDRHARDLPWRRGRDEPHAGYRAVVSELMLQQTQVARVVPLFERFIERFPTPARLAEASEDDVLAMWSGLGYYRRARLLHAAACAMVMAHGGQTPREARALQLLPGVGRYTAGAVASIVFNEPTPIVDGNVGRVLLRLHGRDGALDERDTQRWLWERAEELATVAGRERVSACNEGLMELGATVCTPATPDCEACPLCEACVAKATKRQSEIPRPKARAERRPLWFAMVLVRNSRGQILLEQRGSTGMWARMWQPIAAESATEPSGPAAVLERLGGLADVEDEVPTDLSHATTHRDVRFRLWQARWPGGRVPVGRWFSRRAAGELALSNPVRRLLAIREPGEG
ncbi:MAG: A/G-specific adenine glycosylase [Planctomycetota bacterium]